MDSESFMCGGITEQEMYHSPPPSIDEGDTAVLTWQIN